MDLKQNSPKFNFIQKNIINRRKSSTSKRSSSNSAKNIINSFRKKTQTNKKHNILSSNNSSPKNKNFQSNILDSLTQTQILKIIEDNNIVVENGNQFYVFLINGTQYKYPVNMIKKKKLA